MGDALARGKARVIGQLANRIFRQPQHAAFVKLDLGMRGPAGPDPRRLEQRRVRQRALPPFGRVKLYFHAAVEFCQPRVPYLAAKRCGQKQAQRNPTHGNLQSKLSHKKTRPSPEAQGINLLGRNIGARLTPAPGMCNYS